MLSSFHFADTLNDGLVDGSVRLCNLRIAYEMVTCVVNSAQELQRRVRGTTADNAVDPYVRPLLDGLLVRTD